MVDSLESRTMLSVSLDANGWTTFQPDAGDHVIYVSSSQGKDTNTGLSPATPVKTLQRAKKMIRNRTGDEMLLKACDVWHEGIGIWTPSGKSASDPIIISSYGSGARPLLMTGVYNGIQTGVMGAEQVDHVAIIGLHFYADGRDPNSSTYVSTHPNTGIDWLTKGDGLLIENVELEDYTININLQGYFGTISNTQIRRTTSNNAWAAYGHAQGLYATNVNNLLVENSTFDHDGWNEKIAGAGAVIQNHDLYLAADTSGVIVRNNVISRASAYGLQARGGGTIQNNLFLNDPMGMCFGLVNGAKTTAGGVSGSVTGNIFMGATDLGQYPASGLEIANVKPGAGLLVANNIFADATSDSRSAISLTFGSGISNNNQAVGVNDVTIQNNIFYNWHSGVRIDGGFVPGGSGPTALNRVKIINNQFSSVTGSILSVGGAMDYSQETWSGNQYAAGSIITINGRFQVGGSALLPPIFSNPQVTAAAYNASQGGAATLVDFLARESAQSHTSWKSNYDVTTVVSYFRAGFQ